MEKVTLFIGFNQPVGDFELISILQDIRDGKYKHDIENIRLNVTSGDYEGADQLKRQLPAFTPSGTFQGGRKMEFFQAYSGFVHLDFDKLQEDQLTEAFHRITELQYTYSCFRSPSNKGLKVIVGVTSDASVHDIAYKQVQSYYEYILKIPCDTKCKDITRLCFVSFDEDCFISSTAVKFEVQVSSVVSQDNPARTPNPSGDINVFYECISFTEEKEQYHPGNRNNFVYLLACNCNRKGIPENVALDLITTNFDLAEKEIGASVRSAYQHNGNEFANFAKTANGKNILGQKVDSFSGDNLKATPMVPLALYNQLPSLLKSGAVVFSDPRERDVFLTGAISILSGCMPNVFGVYDKQTVYPNLFSFIIAPAASGKGVLRFAKKLADQYHGDVVKTSRDALQQYNIELNEYKSRQRSKKKDEPVEEPPSEPRFTVVFIPANSSYARVLEHLDKNGGSGVICETEADTMGNVWKQEWGGYSDMLRKAFHHERISSSKKMNNEFIEVEEPRLSVSLSGTPNQVTGLITSAEDGLFSRFLFYVFKVDQRWRDVSPYANNINLTDHFKKLSEYVNEMVRFLIASPSEIQLSRNQWDRLNATCDKWLQDVIALTGEEAGSVIKRLGLILYRIAMIFSVLRKFENGIISDTVCCTDDDFSVAMSLSQIFLDHSLLMFHNLPRQQELTIFRYGDNKRKFFDALPPGFKRSVAIEIGKTFKLSERTTDNLLKELLDVKYLMQPQYGCYSKVIT